MKNYCNLYEGYEQLLRSFVLNDQTLRIKKTYAITILSEADAINSFLNSNEQYYPERVCPAKKMAESKVLWKSHLNKLVDFKNKYLFEKTTICKIQNSTVNKDNLLFSLPKELLEYIMSFVDVSDVDSWREQIIEIPNDDRINMKLMGDEFIKLDLGCVLS